MKTICYQSQHLTVRFAVEELRRLLKNIGIQVNVFQGIANKGSEDRIILQTVEAFNQSTLSGKQVTIEHDGFSIIKENDTTWIIGTEAHAMLYGVYHYSKINFGYQWIDFHERRSKESEELLNDGFQKVFTPTFSRRGNILETIDDPIYIKQLIDWSVKNGQNELFFTFSLWDKVKKYIYDDIVKRNLPITLGGHSLNYLLKNSKQIVDEKERLNFFAQGNPLQEVVINEMIAICSSDSVVTRISLWPEDVGIDEDNAQDFIPSYIAFTEKLKHALKQAQLDIDVEHVVYNAGLDWNMLERKENTEASNQVDVLYAFWGRDYSQSLLSSELDQSRAYDELKDWRDQTKNNGREFTVLEYYSDHFMLSELFPPLIHRINDDIKVYKQQGIDGLLNLIVPLHVKPNQSTLANKYPWKWIHHLNNYVFTRLSWGEAFESTVEEYFSSFGDDQERYKQAICELEQLVARHTRFNVPLFPARIVDPEKVDHTDLTAPIIGLLQQIISYIEKQDLSTIDSLLELQDKNNFHTFTPEEMTQFYFYYLKQEAAIQLQQWKFK